MSHRTFLIVALVMASAAISSGWGTQTDRISVEDGRPVASAIKSLETRFGRAITYEDPPLVHPDDTLDVTESVRRDLQNYAPGKAPRVIVPRGGELSVEFGRDARVEVVFTQVLSEFTSISPSTAFRIEETNGIIHVIPHSMKGPTGETIPVHSILDAPVQLPAQERNGIELLEAWAKAVSTSSKQQILIGGAPTNTVLPYKDDRGLSSSNARDAMTEILSRIGKRNKLSWQLLYSPGQKVYFMNIHIVR